MIYLRRYGIAALASALLFMSGVTIASTETGTQQKNIYGRAEHVKLQNGLTLKARMDTGATTSSIDARNIRKFDKDGETWVEFDVIDRDTDKKYQIVLPYFKTIPIKSRSEEGGKGFKERYVVLMKVCLGNEQQTVEVNLTNRNAFSYPFLFGRQAMYKFDAIIDPSLTYTHKLNCSGK